MRWPIHRQLLLPMLLIAVLAIGLTSAISGSMAAARVRRQQEDNLHRVLTTLTEAAFPLTERVLRQMSGLSGAEFVLLDDRGRVEANTLGLTPRDLDVLRHLPLQKELRQVSADPVAEIAGRRYLGHRVPVLLPANMPPRQSLVVLYEEDRWRSTARQAAYPAMVAGCLAALAAMFMAAVVARRFVGPIQQLGHETARIAEGCFQPVAVPARNDEIRDLALSVNSMAEKLSRYEAAVRDRERLRTLTQLGAGMAHQLRNSATGARMAIELHRRGSATGKSGEALDVAMRQLRLMESYLQRFLQIDRGGQRPRTAVDLVDSLQGVLDLVQPACVHGGIELDFSAPAEHLVVWADGDALRDLLMNVTLNAVEAAKRPGSPQPRVRVELTRLSADRALIRVKDTGAGPADAVQTSLFDPFVTDKPEGVGLGLFLARRVAEAHGGSIGWQRQDGWTCFSIELPLRPLDDSHGASAGH